MVSSILLLALAVQATPVPMLSNPQFLPQDIREDPSTAIPDHDGVRPIRSYNPFDLSGIFARADRKPKEEPHENHGLNPNIPPSTALTILLPIKVEGAEGQLPIHSLLNLNHLKSMAEKALHDKQVLEFFRFMEQILANCAEDNAQIPSNVRNAALEISKHFSALWDIRKETDILYIEDYIPNSTFNYATSESLPSDSDLERHQSKAHLFFFSSDMGSIGEA
ncbi:hypothetical protein H0H93_015070 [Arthromyces matolae]|nr:hypothetical protein H0H93_015070 [Arthromyces matolae]